jgi:ComF family protein
MGMARIVSRAGVERMLRSGIDALIEQVLPERCLVCGRFGAALHPECVVELPRADGIRCPRCWVPSRRTDAGTRCHRCAEDAQADGLDALRTSFTFTDAARRSILEAKFRGITRLLDPLGATLADEVQPMWRPDVIVPIPLTTRRYRRRGFNQSELLARRVAEATEVPLRLDLLRRAREADSQASLDAEQRQRNVRGVFAADDATGLRVLVIDDVTTTGATLNEAAQVLRAAGATHVFGLAVARED